MARIAGVNIPVHKHAVVALTAIYGIGNTRAKLILDSIGVRHDMKISELTEGDLEKVRQEVGKYVVEGRVTVSGPRPTPAPARGRAVRSASKRPAPHRSSELVNGNPQWLKLLPAPVRRSRRT